MNPIRVLTAREIECRVAQIKKNGLQLLLYKNSRADMNILDETFGPMNWQRRHSRDNANCIVSIWDESKHQWIEKEDTGTESNTEAEKGLASDSFKRACVNVGIGRELYTSPFIWVTSANCEIKETQQGRLVCNDRFEVSEIGYTEHREINRLVIVNSKTRNVVYHFGDPSSDGQKRPSKALQKKATKDTTEGAGGDEKGLSGPQRASQEQIQYLKDVASDEDYERLMTLYGPELENLTADVATDEITSIDLKNTQTDAVDGVVKCERCGNAITGVILPDKSLMSASQLIGKSKLTYNGVYCYPCMKELSKKRKAG